MHNWTIDGRCPCGGRFVGRTVEVRIAPPPGGDPIVLDSVPQGACPTCGSRVYRAAMLCRLETAMAEAHRGLNAPA